MDERATTEINTILVLRLAQLSHECAFLLHLVHIGPNFAMRSVDIPPSDELHIDRFSEQQLA